MHFETSSAQLHHVKLVLQQELQQLPRAQNKTGVTDVQQEIA